MYLISAYFDNKTNRILQEYIDAVAESTGNRFMLDNNVPPHMTICAVEARSKESLLPAFDAYRQLICEGEIEFVAMGQMMPNVLFAQPYMNKYLMDLSEKSYSCFSKVPDTIISKYYVPYSWLPHVTIAKNLTSEQMVKAVAATTGVKPFAGRITDIGIARISEGFDEKYSLSCD